MTSPAWDGKEPLLDDDRLEQIADMLRAELGTEKLEQATFLTFVSPATTVMKRTADGLEVPVHVKEMATFAIVEPNPRPYAKAQNLMVLTHGTVALEDWEEDEHKRKHYVGKGDPALPIYRLVAKDHVERLTNLREMI